MMEIVDLEIFDGNAQAPRNEDPAIRVRKHGSIEFNKMALLLLDLKPGCHVSFAHETRAVHKWYVRKSDSTGLEIRSNRTVNSRKLAAALLDDAGFDNSQPSMKLGIDISETKKFDGGYHLLIFSV